MQNMRKFNILTFVTWVIIRVSICAPNFNRNFVYAFVFVSFCTCALLSVLSALWLIKHSMNLFLSTISYCFVLCSVLCYKNSNKEIFCTKYESTFNL